MNSGDRRRRDAATRRLAALLAAFSVFFAPLATRAHLALEEHHWCPSHAAIEHDAGGRSPADSTPDPAPSPSDRDHGPNHSTCAMTSIAPVDRPDAPAVAIDLGSVSEPRAHAVAPQPPPPSIATLAIAPKTSPPTLL